MELDERRNHHRRGVLRTSCLSVLCGRGLTHRTAGCGPACPVVWEGRRGDSPPYPDYCDLVPRTAYLGELNYSCIPSSMLLR
jgi:hypothetical protein